MTLKKWRKHSTHYLETQVTVAFGQFGGVFFSSSFFQSSQYQSLSVSKHSPPHPPTPLMGQQHTKGEELLPRIAALAAQRPTVLLFWEPERTLITLLCAMWALCPTGWLVDLRNVGLWLDSVLSVLKWWVHISTYLQLFTGKKKKRHLLPFSFSWETASGEIENKIPLDHRKILHVCMFEI